MLLGFHSSIHSHPSITTAPMLPAQRHFSAETLCLNYHVVGGGFKCCGNVNIEGDQPVSDLMRHIKAANAAWITCRWSDVRLYPATQSLRDGTSVMLARFDWKTMKTLLCIPALRLKSTARIDRYFQPSRSCDRATDVHVLVEIPGLAFPVRQEVVS